MVGGAYTLFPVPFALNGGEVGFRKVFCFGDVFNGLVGRSGGVEGADAGGAGEGIWWDCRTRHFECDDDASRQVGRKSLRSCVARGKFRSGDRRKSPEKTQADHRYRRQ